MGASNAARRLLNNGNTPQSGYGGDGGCRVDIGYLEMKLAALESKYGHFLRYEKSLVGLKERLIQQIREQEQMDYMKQTKELVVVEVSKFYKN